MQTINPDDNLLNVNSKKNPKLVMGVVADHHRFGMPLLANVLQIKHLAMAQ